jgi:hypothetical protein
MSFTGRLGSALSYLSNLVLGYGAVEHPVARSTSTITIPKVQLSGTGTFTAPRYPLVQTTGKGFTGGGTLVLTFPGAVTAGDLITVSIACSGGAVTPALVDTGGNTYHRATTANRVGQVCEIWYAYNITGGAAPFTVTITGATTIRASADEWSGFGTLDPLKGTAQAAGSGNVTLTSSATLVNPNAIGISAVCTANIQVATLSGSPTSGSPAWVQEWNDGGLSGAAYHAFIKAAGTPQAVWSSGGGWSVGLAVFQDPTDFAGMRVNQQVQSTASLDSTVARFNQITQITASVDSGALRLNQVVLTLVTLPPTITVNPGCPADVPTLPVTPAPGCDPDPV